MVGQMRDMAIKFRVKTGRDAEVIVIKQIKHKAEASLYRQFPDKRYEKLQRQCEKTRHYHGCLTIMPANEMTQVAYTIGHQWRIKKMADTLFEPIEPIDEYLSVSYGGRCKSTVFFRIRQKHGEHIINACPYKMGAESKFVQKTDFVSYLFRDGNTIIKHCGLAIMIFDVREAEGVESRTRILIHRCTRRQRTYNSVIFPCYAKCFYTDNGQRAIFDDVLLENITARHDIIIDDPSITATAREANTTNSEFFVVIGQQEYNKPWDYCP